MPSKITAVGTILSIIVASITIMNFTASKNKDTSDSSSQSINCSHQEGNKTQESSAASSSYGNATNSEGTVVKQELTPIRHLQMQQRVTLIRLPLLSAATATTSGNATTGGNN